MMQLGLNVCVHIPASGSRQANLHHVHTAWSFLYAHNIGERDKQNILNIELALFLLKSNVSTKQVTIREFFVKKTSYLHTGLLK
jgi:hypothetical protein